jgi:hypothetical protein
VNGSSTEDLESSSNTKISKNLQLSRQAEEMLSFVVFAGFIICGMLLESNAISVRIDVQEDACLEKEYGADGNYWNCGIKDNRDYYASANLVKASLATIPVVTDSAAGNLSFVVGSA